VGHALARASILVLGAAALFQLVTGVLNIAYWYSPMPFAFIASHYWVGWLVIGSILLHVALKLPIIRGALSRQHARPASHTASDAQVLSRRGLLAAVAGAVGVVTLATVGQTVRPLKGVSVLAPRRPDVGPQGVPVNTSAQAAGVLDAISDPAYRLVLSGPAGDTMFTLDQIAALPQSTVDLPITCVEGWSADGTWTGVRIRELVALAGGDPDHASVLVRSLQQGGPYSTSILDASHTADPLSILALRLNGETLHADHGYPVRLIGPSRPGVMQTKWVTAVRVVAS
jgi:DMSO/TMAO reductase YedYZ molybdopterin-dependent catalytic subunit